MGSQQEPAGSLLSTLSATFPLLKGLSNTKSFWEPKTSLILNPGTEFLHPNPSTELLHPKSWQRVAPSQIPALSFSIPNPSTEFSPSQILAMSISKQCGVPSAELHQQETEMRLTWLKHDPKSPGVQIPGVIPLPVCSHSSGCRHTCPATSGVLGM